jgi:N-methylhydantoinase A
MEVGKSLRGAGWHLSLSHRVANEFREYERTCTTVANAMLARPMESYLTALGRRLGSRRLKIMASSGGWVSVRRAAAEPIRTVLSGPAGGALAAMHLGRTSGHGRLITLDMGGTSTDVSLCDGRIPRVHGTELDGFPLRIPTLDIQSVGAGGGSLARVDAGGALRVGPESAGAEPGPACYRRGGEEATLTDALLVLGRLLEEGLLGGEISLDRDAAENAVGRIGRRLGLGVEKCALGIVRVAEAALERAVRRISAGRGHHPGRFSLLVFGGGGGLHACSLALSLGVKRVLIPPNPGTFSALGLCMSPPTWEVARTVLIRGREFSARKLARLLAPLEREARGALLRDGHAPRAIRLEREADVRYLGQSHEITLPVTRRLSEAFHFAHRREFGYERRDEETELVNLRVRALADSFAPPARGERVRRRRASPHGSQSAVLDNGRRVKIPVIRRESLHAGDFFPGPALVTEYSATTWVAPGFLLERDSTGLLALRKAGRKERRSRA